jgi:XTP/dITP diphosphohydrolase
MSENKFNELKSVISELREKCPWDRKQTFQSLRSLTIEEVYELSEAIINQDPKNIEEESGDLLLHILFYAKLGEEKKLFSINTIIEKLIFKLKERHPHIYGNLKAKTSEEVEANWEKIKKRKRKSSETLSNISNKLPPLVKAMRIQEKVKTVGFDYSFFNHPIKSSFFNYFISTIVYSNIFI